MEWEQTYNAQTHTYPSSWLPCPKRKPGNLNTNDELKKQAGTTAESSYCVEAIAFTKVSELLPWMRTFVEQKKVNIVFLDFGSFGTFLWLQWYSL